MFEVAKEYDYVFRSILDVHNGTNGWYSPTSHIQLPLASQSSGHLDFVEIGTSDFDTETQRADINSVGLCIEPIGLYLNRLPSWPHVKKIQKAISNTSGETSAFYVAPEDVERYGLPAWVKGCNTIGKPHPTVLKLLVERELDAASLLRQSTVPVQTLYECLVENGAQSIRYLKIDTEGHDCAILDQFALDLEANKRLDLRPAKIKFESNELTPSTTVDSTIARWVALGYRVGSRGYDTILDL
jgi:FkbM family methyltransferase